MLYSNAATSSVTEMPHHTSRFNANSAWHHPERRSRPEERPAGSCAPRPLFITCDASDVYRTIRFCNHKVALNLHSIWQSQLLARLSLSLQVSLIPFRARASPHQSYCCGAGSVSECAGAKDVPLLTEMTIDTCSRRNMPR